MPLVFWRKFVTFALVKYVAYILLTMLCMVAMPSSGQGVDSLLRKQRKLFPQEKVYVMTDRDLYLAGDTARMRAWIYDCLKRKPQSQSKYLYVELRDAADNLKVRVKLENSKYGQESEQLFRGYIALPPNLTSGDYTLVAYTYYMLGTDEKLFFRKRLHVMNPKDITRGLMAKNLLGSREQEYNSSRNQEDKISKLVPVGSNIAMSITADRLCRADSTSSIVWSLKHQPDVFMQSSMPYEGGQIISGTVYGNISTKKAQPNVRVSMVIPSKKYTDVCITDINGHFMFKGFDLPDSTLVFISAKKGKRTRMENITIDGDSLPELITSLPATPHYFSRLDNVPSEMKVIANTVDLSNTQMLDEIVVKGLKKEKITETYQNLAARTLIADELMDKGINDLETAILHMPGVRYKDGVLCYQGKPLRFFIDGIEEEYDPEDDGSLPSLSSMVALSYPLDVVQRIDLLRPADTAFLIGGAGGGGMAAICITLKDGTEVNRHSRSTSLKFVWPLGYQRYKKFQLPPADKAWPVIYWHSNITIKDGNDLAKRIRSIIGKRRQAGDRGSYTVHIDGFTPEGKPIHVEHSLYEH